MTPIEAKVPREPRRVEMVKVEEKVLNICEYQTLPVIHFSPIWLWVVLLWVCFFSLPQVVANIQDFTRACLFSFAAIEPQPSSRLLNVSWGLYAVAFLFQKIALLMLFMCQYVPVSLYFFQSFFFFFWQTQPLCISVPNLFPSKRSERQPSCLTIKEQQPELRLSVVPPLSFLLF